MFSYWNIIRRNKVSKKRLVAAKKNIAKKRYKKASTEINSEIKTDSKETDRAVKEMKKERFKIMGRSSSKIEAEKKAKMIGGFVKEFKHKKGKKEGQVGYLVYV